MPLKNKKGRLPINFEGNIKFFIKNIQLIRARINKLILFLFSYTSGINTIILGFNMP